MLYAPPHMTAETMPMTIFAQTSNRCAAPKTALPYRIAIARNGDASRGLVALAGRRAR